MHPAALQSQTLSLSALSNPTAIMPSNTAASMFGGAGGKGSRASVASLQGLRNVLRNENQTDSAPAAPGKPGVPPPPGAPATPADDKQTLRGLNDRLSGYLGRVKQLEKENGDLETQIDEILAKRKGPVERDWDEVEKPLEDLKKQIKDLTLDNAKLLLQIDNTKLAKEDFENKLRDEKKARIELEKDLEHLKKTNEDTKLNHKQTQKEIDLVKEELDHLKKEHKEEADAFREKIKESEVKVEIDSQNSNLSEILNKIRSQYDKLAKKNLKETEDWYQSKFDNIKVVEAQNSESLQSSRTELKNLLKQKQSLDIEIQSLHSTMHNLEEALMSTKKEYAQRLTPCNKMILNLEAELKEVRSQVEQHVETNHNLLCVKMKLEAEINNYQQLIHGMTADAESLEFSLEDALHSGQPKPDHKVPEQQEDVKEEVLVKEQSAPSPPKAPEDEADADQPPEMMNGDLMQVEEDAAEKEDEEPTEGETTKA